jgi:hypothetical protein
VSDIFIYSKVIQENRPLLKRILQDYGDLSILETTNLLLEKGKKHKSIYDSEFINLIKKTFPHLGKAYLQKLDACLKNNPVVSTADHQCPINHPVYINSSVQLSLFAKQFSENEKPYIMPPILSFSSLPLNNTAYLRGLLMAFPQGEKRFSFFGTSMRHMALPMVQSLSFNKTSINQWVKANSKNFTNNQLNEIKILLEKISKETEINKCKDYSEQISVWNKWLWQNFFPDYGMEFLPIDLLSKTFFTEILIHNPGLSLYKFLFSLSQETLIKLFDGIYGCWSTKTNGGTFFFWGVDKRKSLMQLKLKNNQLIADDKTFASIDWNPSSIAKAWKDKKILPALLTNYLIIAGHYGLFCSGAFNQIGYLQPIIKAYSIGLRKVNLISEAQRVEQMQTDGVHAFLYFLFGATKDLAIPLCGLNMLQEKNKINKIEDVLKKITVNKAFSVTAPLNFPYIVSASDVKKYDFSFEKSYREIRKIIPEELIIQDWN